MTKSMSIALMISLSINIFFTVYRYFTESWIWFGCTLGALVLNIVTYKMFDAMEERRIKSREEFDKFLEEYREKVRIFQP